MQQTAQRATGQAVSIHTRHFWRVNRLDLAAAGGADVVSIHTRHFWRVNPRDVGRYGDMSQVSIHTRHFWRVNPPVLNLALAVNYGKFQSTPAISGG